MARVEVAWGEDGAAGLGGSAEAADGGRVGTIAAETTDGAALARVRVERDATTRRTVGAGMAETAKAESSVRGEGAAELKEQRQKQQAADGEPPTRSREILQVRGDAVRRAAMVRAEGEGPAGRRRPVNSVGGDSEGRWAVAAASGGTTPAKDRAGKREGEDVVERPRARRRGYLQRLEAALLAAEENLRLDMARW